MRGDAEVAEHDGVLVGRGGGPPGVHGLLAASGGVEPVPGEGGQDRVLGPVAAQAFEHVVVGGRGEAPGPVEGAGAVERPCGGGPVAAPQFEVGAVEPRERRDVGAAADQRHAGGLFEQFGGGLVVVDGEVFAGDVQDDRRVVGGLVLAQARGQVARPRVEGVVAERARHQGGGAVGLAASHGGDGGEVAGLGVVRGAVQQRVEVFGGLGGASGGQVEAGGGDRGGIAPGPVPHGGAERGAGLGGAPLPGEDQAEPVVGFAVAGVGVAGGEAGDGGAQVLLRRFEAAVVLAAGGERGVAAGVAGVAAQRLFPVRFGRARGVAVLGQVEAGEVELVDRVDVGGRGRFGRGPGEFGVRAVAVGARAPGDERLAFVLHGQFAVARLGGRVERGLVDVRRAGREVDGGLVQDPLARSQHDAGAGPRGGDGGGDADAGAVAAGLEVEADGGLAGGLVDRAGLLDRVPVLGEGLGLAGFEVGEVGLVVGEHPGHELDVGAAGVGQVRVPGPAEGRVAPGPLLLAGGDAVVGPVDEAGAGAVVVAAEEVVLGAQAHVRGGHRDVAVPVEAVAVRALGGAPRGVVDAVVAACGGREGGGGALGVVGDHAHVGGEEGLVVVVRLGGHVGPPQEGLDLVGAVDQVAAQLDERAAGAQAYAVHALHAREGVVVGAPDRRRSVLIVLDEGLGRQVRGGPVVLGPVELDAAGDPRPEQADQGRFDDLVAVEEVVARGLVVADVDAPAQFGQDHQPHVLVLQVHRVPLPRGLLLGDLVDERQRVDRARGALVDALVEVGRVAVGLAGLVGVDGDALAPGPHGPVGDRLGS